MRLALGPARAVRQESTDVLVVGSGPGGAITAALLAEAGLDVVVCEEGAWVEHGALAQFSVEQMSGQYRNGGLTAALGRPPIAYAEARCAGGGSEVNSGLYHRPPPPLVEAWRRDAAIRDLDTTSLDAHSEVIERELCVSALPGPAPEASAVLERGARALGWAVAEVPRWYHDVSAAGGAGGPAGRQTMTRTYLPRAVRAGAQVRSGWRVERLLHDGRRVRGARCVVVGPEPSTVDVTARRVVVCGGAVQSPALLQRSGVRGTVGRTLRMHPTVKLVARFPHPMAHEDVPVHQVKEFAPDLSFGGSWSSAGQVALALSDDWAGRAGEMAAPDHLAVYYAAIRSQGTGRVVAVPGWRDPVVTYRLTPADLDRLRRGAARLALLLLRAGATAVWPSVRAAPGARTPEEIPAMVACFAASALSLMTVHLFSSAPMGERDIDPVDSFGRVKALDGVWINDASILPTAPGVNPQGTILALARRNIVRWLDDGAFRG